MRTWICVALAACGGTAPPASAPAPAPPEAPAMSESERKARSWWFAYELEGVTDWDAFIEARRAEEKAFGESEDDRAQRVLQEEFEIVMADRDAALAEARRVLGLLAAGDFATVATDCVQYGGADRARLCSQSLEGRRGAIEAAVRDLDLDALDAASLQFTRPEPEAGMTGQVVLPFGPPAPPPAEDGRFPPTWQIELWWSGPVMPDANGPVHARPLSADQPPGRWRFFDVTAPYSLVETYRI